MTESDVIKAHILTDSLLFTRYFFKARFGRSFVVNTHHKIIGEALDRVFSGQTKKLAIRIAPRYGKTEQAVKNFISHGLAINPKSKFIHLSYSQQLALDNSEEVRDFIQEEEYQRLFPHVKLSKSSTAKNKWYTTQGGGVYATATGGQITGFGAGEVDELDEFLNPINNTTFSGAIVIDDPLKADDADSEVKRERVNQRFETTIRSRTNSRNTPIIIIGQALHERDLIGYLMETEPDEWELITLPCIVTDDNGEEKALWEFKQTLEELKKIRSADERVFEIQYQQNPTSEKGKLLPLSKLRFQDISNIPTEAILYKFSAGDPADTGGDHFSCPMLHVAYYENQFVCFVKDVVHTQDGIEAANMRIVDKMREHLIEDIYVEVNGVGTASYLLMQRDLANHAVIKPFNSTIPKEVRILSHYEFVAKYFVFDSRYKEFPEYRKFIDHITSYERKGQNKNKKDAIDVLCTAANILKIKFGHLLYN